MKTISLTKRKKTFVDDEDYEWLSQWNWCFSGNGYALRGERKGGKYKNITMHREILKAPPGLVVDHINGNGLDNRRENLRLCSEKQNHQNQRIHIDNRSGFKGMNYRKERDRWQAQIVVENKNIHLGYYKTPEEAAKAYNEAAVNHFGEFACLNKL